jgi:hypothetical protein
MDEGPLDFVPDAQSMLMNCLSQIVSKEEDDKLAVPMKFVCVVEYGTLEGKTYCMRFGDENSAIWDRMGLLQFGMMAEARALGRME